MLQKMLQASVLLINAVECNLWENWTIQNHILLTLECLFDQQNGTQMEMFWQFVDPSLKMEENQKVSFNSTALKVNT